MNNITLAPVQTDQPSHLMPVFGRQPISFVRGRGSYLYTEDGTEYLDALTGIAVCGLGHAHPTITEAIADQAATLIHTSNLFEVPWQTAAAQKLAQVAGMEEVFFSNSGAESNEGAIKIARKFGHMQGIASPKIIVADQSFHGRTMATLSATGNKKVQEGFGPLVRLHWCSHVPSTTPPSARSIILPVKRFWMRQRPPPASTNCHCCHGWPA